jgi:2'-deoxynucleoside 5'-phosphate N-hydrolase
VRVYLAAAMTNAARDLGAIRALLASIEGEGHEVPTRHVADPRGRNVEGDATDAEVAERDLAWVMGCDALIAEVSTPSHGVGVEVATALQHGVPVLLLHRRDAVVSRLMLGLAGVESAAYSDPGAIAPAVRSFLARASRRAAAPDAEA